MCSTAKALMVQDCCFCAEQDDGLNAYGCSSQSGSAQCCTRNKQVLSASETESYDVTIPAVENLSLRTACCCYYCGLGFRLADKPFGLTNEVTMLCYQYQGGCHLLFTEVKKRSCCSYGRVLSCLACETTGSSEFVIYEDSIKGGCVCCIDSGQAIKVSCCPTPLTCIGSQGQTCCYYSRMNFPCNDLTPCEVGCCGIFCINKEEQIKEAEQRIRDRAQGGAVEAVVVEKGGAPVEVMER